MKKYNPLEELLKAFEAERELIRTNLEDSNLSLAEKSLLQGKLFAMSYVIGFTESRKWIITSGTDKSKGFKPTLKEVDPKLDSTGLFPY